MIETVIAFGVLVAAILGPVALVAFSIAQSRSSQNKLIAVNLGQEGIELVRAIRDNNVICGFVWNKDPDSATNMGEGGNNLFTVDANETATLTCGPASFPTPKPTPDPNCSTRALNLNANGYTYGAGTPTPFRRCVTICIPSSSAPCNGTVDSDVDALDSSGKPTQMEIISKVFWLDRGLQRSIQFQERLYNWR